MKARLAKKIFNSSNCYWTFKCVVTKDTRLTKASRILKRKAKKLAALANVPLRCSTCKWDDWVEEDGDIYHDCPMNCLYYNHWQLMDSK
nr:MAG TPA: hypothetical protein [Caudoviricetes sp.]